MSITYDKSTNFTAKDSMATTNPDKLLSGVPFDFEFDAISVAFEQAAPTLDATFTGTTTTDALVATTVNGSNTSDWDTAYGWGDHGAEGYLTSFSETDPTVPAHVKAITTTNVSDWESAHVIADRLDAREEVWDATTDVVADKELIWDNKVDEVPSPTAGAQYARVDGAWAVVQAGAASSLTQAQIDAFTEASEWVTDNGDKATEWDDAYAYGDHSTQGYITDQPAIISDGSTPSLSSGISDAEVRSLIGAGTSSFSGDYSDLTNKPAIPTNNNQLTNGAGYTTYTGSDAVKTTGTQTISGTKTFQSTIGGNISGNSATATYAADANNASTADLATRATNCTRSVIAGTNLSGGGSLTENRTINLNSSLTNLTSVDTDTVEVGVFTITTRSNGFLEIKIGNSKLFELDSDGDLRIKGNVTAYTTGF